MATDWKTLYADHWRASTDREHRLAFLATAATGVQFNPHGTGAGQTGRVKGYHGGADFLSITARTFLEVTGPHVYLPTHYPLWIRPDKFATAAREYLENGRITVILHEVPPHHATIGGIPLVRPVILAGRSARRWQENGYRIESKRPMGKPEDYVILSTTDRQVTDLTTAWGIIQQHERKGA